jgi:hypothetical protein
MVGEAKTSAGGVLLVLVFKTRKNFPGFRLISFGTAAELLRTTTSVSMRVALAAAALTVPGPPVGVDWLNAACDKNIGAKHGNSHAAKGMCFVWCDLISCSLSYCYGF